MQKANDFRDQSVDELKAQHFDKCRERFNLINKLKSTRKADQPHLLRQLKKEIARILTVLREKEIAAEQSGA